MGSEAPVLHSTKREDGKGVRIHLHGQKVRGSVEHRLLWRCGQPDLGGAGEGEEACESAQGEKSKRHKAEGRGRKQQSLSSFFAKK